MYLKDHACQVDSLSLIPHERRDNNQSCLLIHVVQHLLLLPFLASRNFVSRFLSPFLSDEGPMLETLDYTIRIGSIPTFLYFDLYLYSAYAAHFVYFTFGSFTFGSFTAATLCLISRSFVAVSVTQRRIKGGATGACAPGPPHLGAPPHLQALVNFPKICVDFYAIFAWIHLTMAVQRTLKWVQEIPFASIHSSQFLTCWRVNLKSAQMHMPR